MRKTLYILLSLLLLLGLTPPSAVFAADSPSEYAAQFIEKCEGQQWLLDETQRLLNAAQKSVNTLQSAADLDFVTSLGLADRALVGRLPAAIGEFHKLRSLYLSGNRLTGSIPAELFLLPALENIDLSDNQYSGGIPTGFGGMTALKTLSLQGNAFSGVLPADLLGNAALTLLDVSGNRLGGSIPAELNQMTGLQYLCVSDNPWSAGALPELSALTGLKVLSAWGCGLTGGIPASLYGMTGLQVLDLADNSLSGTLSADLASLTELQLLALGGNRLEGTVPAQLSALSKLTVLDLSDNALRGKLPASVASIAELYAQHNYMTGDVLAGLTHCQGNFCDAPTAEQYQLTPVSPAVAVSQTAKTNLYALLSNSGSASKGLLPADCYQCTISNDDDNKLALTTDALGIYVQAYDKIERSENIVATFQIKDNDGSTRSKTEFVLTTEHIISVSAGGGGDTSVPSKPPVQEPYISGYPDGGFAPSRSVTRGELSAMLVKVMDGTPAASETTGLPSAPASELTHWSAPYVAAAKRLGVLQGYDDGSFKPSASMTRAELTTCLVRLAEVKGLAKSSTSKTFRDVDPSMWYTPYIEAATQYGFVSGYSDGSFQPDSFVTRAEAVTMINHILGRNLVQIQTLKNLPCPFHDVDESHWAYWNIIGASASYTN